MHSLVMVTLGYQHHTHCTYVLANRACAELCSKKKKRQIKQLCDKEIIVDKVGFPTVEDMLDEVGYQYELVLLTPPLHTCMSRQDVV